MAIKRSGVGYADFSGGDLNFVIRGERGDCECSPGCENCYAREILGRYGNLPAETKTYPEKLYRLRQASCPRGGEPFRRGLWSRPLAFACDFGDLFHKRVPDSFIVQALDVMVDRDDVDWLVLTKRAARMAGLVGAWRRKRRKSVPEHLWLGASVCTRREAMMNLPIVDAMGRMGATTWISYEPALVGIDWHALLGRYHVDWLVCGAESGKKRRRFHLNWARQARDGCTARKVAFFYKQGSATWPGQKRELDGREWNEFPR